MLGLLSSFVFHVASGAPAPQENVGFLQQRTTETAPRNFSSPAGTHSGITEPRIDGNFSNRAHADDNDRALLLQNTVSECKDSSTSCIDRAFKGDCETNRDYMQANCKLSCGVCSNIWCQSGIFCSSDSAAHSSQTKIRFDEKCHGYCFPKSCGASWEKCVGEAHTGSKAEVCSEAKQVNCYVPLAHTPISDAAASRALDDLLADLEDEPDKMNMIGKHRSEILGYLVRGIGPEYVPKAILPDEPLLKASAAPSDELAPLAASTASAVGCITEIAAVSVDSVFLVASITKLGSALKRDALVKNLGNNLKKVARAAQEKLGRGPVAKSVYELSAKGTSKWKQAGASFAVFVGTTKVVSIGLIMKAIRQSLQNVSWWRWLWMGVQVAAQLAAWTLTGGAAFIAQAVGVITNFAFLVLDAVALAGKLRNGCGSSTSARPPAPEARRRRSTTVTTTKQCSWDEGVKPKKPKAKATASSQQLNASAAAEPNVSAATSLQRPPRPVAYCYTKDGPTSRADGSYANFAGPIQCTCEKMIMDPDCRCSAAGHREFDCQPLPDIDGIVEQDRADGWLWQGQCHAECCGRMVGGWGHPEIVEAICRVSRCRQR